MMIIDLNQVMISTFMSQIGNHTNVKVEEDLLRHMILNCIRSYIRKFKEEYGEVVIACDDRHYWRREVYPYYKANRRKSREASEIDWNVVFESLNKIREELKLYFPYRVIQADGAEADDVIGTLVEKFGNTHEKILILSGDKDFVQLQTYMNVKQYDPVRKKFVEHNDPSRFVKEQIMRGDAGDGVPNFLSADNCFVVGARQKPLSQKKLDIWVNQKPEEFCDEGMLRNYNRNQQLIDLSYTPPEVKTRVIEQYDSQSNKNRQNLFNYFVEKKLKHLLENINEF
jgi:5'-3' exonuclease